MKKIPTIFKRDENNMMRILPDPHPDCDWVFRGEGIATRKYDGTCCLVRDSILYKRREIKPGGEFPENFEAVDHDKVTGKTVGWVPVDFELPENRWYKEAYTAPRRDGTYELLGPAINGNPENLAHHVLLKHSEASELNAPRDFVALQEWMKGKDIEGIVWHHPDGRMAKLKLRDFGIKRK